MRVGVDEDAVIDEIVDKLFKLQWDECLLPDIDMSVGANRRLVNRLQARAAYVRSTRDSPSYFIDTARSFESYLSGLSSDARRAIYNKRKLAESLGEVMLTRKSVVDGQHALKVMNALHKSRWGKPALTGKTLEFYENLWRHSRTEAAEFSQFFVGERLVSVL